LKGDTRAISNNLLLNKIHNKIIKKCSYCSFLINGGPKECLLDG